MAWMEKLMMQVALVDQVTRPLAGIQRQMDEVSRSGRQGWANMAMGATTVAAGGMAIQSALGPAIEMDRALAEVDSLGVAKEALKDLSGTALKYSVKYGESATEFVRSSYQIQSAIASLSGTELSGAAYASGVLAKATKADTQTITTYMGTMYGIFKDQAENMGKVNFIEDIASKTATAVQMFKTDGKGMSDAFAALGAAGKKAFVSLDEQFAVLGMLQSTMSGGEAGTKFKAFLAGVGNAQKTLGMQFTDAAGNMLPVLTVLDQLKGRYGDTLSVAEGDELKKAFGSDEAVAMIKLMMDDTKGLATNINALANTHGMGKAEQMAAAMTDQWQRVEQAWFAIRAAAFGVVLPAINAVVGAFADGANDVLRWTQLFPNLTKVVSYALLAIVGLGMVTGTWMLIAGIAKMATLGWGIALGAIMVPLNLLKAGLVTFRAIMLAVNIAMYANPIGLIIAGIVLLIGTVAAVIYYWDDLKKTLADWGVFDAIQAMIDGAATGWANFMQLLANLSPFQLLGKAVDWLIDKLNMIPGVNIELGSMPDLAMPSMPPLNVPVMPGVMNVPAQERQQETVNAPLARYRQQDQSKVPSGGIGQQLIQANAAATSANQKPAKSLHVGEVHITNQNPMTPEQMAENVWLETK
ncbi:phage tail tape measure protein [Aeromonas schubertii]|uniref:phage tail tape measure protein n=1 Tax=Aeromonas schubertii TaxID=652 RepID=UPI0010A7E7E2|nr:phage tail tape measure protein [Aeromonas schubertii]QCG49479.1 phage tail tape measure protein [Aeromonas schubertii]